MSKTITLNCKRCGAPLEPGGPGVGAFAPHTCDAAAACVAVERLIDAALDPRAAALRAAEARVVEAAVEYQRLDVAPNSNQDWKDWHAAFEEFREAVAAYLALLATEKQDG